MALLASHFIAGDTKVAYELQDIEQTRWTQTLLLSYLNEAQRMIALVRPDATATVEAFQLAPGTRQQIPANRLRFIDLPRNMGANGTTPGRVITPIAREDLDAFNLSWHTATAATAVKHYSFDERFPRYFYVTPPVHAVTQVWGELVSVANPTDCADGNSAIALDDVYEGPLEDWILFRAFSLDTDSPANFQRAVAHANSFFQSLGVKSQIDKFMSLKPQGKPQP